MPQIGGLEIRVLTHIWSAPEETDAHSLHNAMSGPVVSLSTIQTTLKRLHRKGLLSRRRVGHAYHYQAAVRREELISMMIEEVSHKLADGNLELVISGFFELIDKTDPALRDYLQAGKKSGKDEA